MASPADCTPTPIRRFRWGRWPIGAAVVYVGILIVILALENWFVYHPVTADRAWIDPKDPSVQDVYLDLPTGERIHAWWWPRPGAEGALLYCHGNAGNL